MPQGDALQQARGPPRPIGRDPKRDVADYDHLANLFVLSVQVRDKTFQDAILDAIVAKSTEPVPLGFKAVPGARP